MILYFNSDYTEVAYKDDTMTLYVRTNGITLSYSPVYFSVWSLISSGDWKMLNTITEAIYGVATKTPKNLKWIKMPLKVIKLYEIDSSNISAIGYDDEQMKLYVEFLSGELYEYMNVPIDVWNGLKNAESRGSFLHFFIKINESAYPYRKISSSNITKVSDPSVVATGTAHPNGWMTEFE